MLMIAGAYQFFMSWVTILHSIINECTDPKETSIGIGPVVGDIAIPGKIKACDPSRTFVFICYTFALIVELLSMVTIVKFFVPWCYRKVIVALNLNNDNTFAHSTVWLLAEFFVYITCYVMTMVHQSIRDGRANDYIQEFLDSGNTVNNVGLDASVEREISIDSEPRNASVYDYGEYDASTYFEDTENEYGLDNLNTDEALEMDEDAEMLPIL